MIQQKQKQIVSVSITNEYIEAYNYLRKLKINCADIIRDSGQNGLYETARKFKYQKRKQNEKQTPFDL